MRCEYIKRNLFPIVVQLLFVGSCLMVEKEAFIYLNFLFYAILSVYFYRRKDFTFKEWIEAIKSGKVFWKQVMLNIIFLFGAFTLTSMFERIFPNIEKGMILLRADNWLEFILFTGSTILFPPIVEETFYRKNLISFRSKKILILTTLFSMFLYASEHALAPWGIILCMVWALPLSISYAKTKNIYVPMTAHLICNVIINGMTVVQLFIFMLK
ncbi:MAG: CPBP family intramembrane metalloprotease [Peptostreptococcaceae bacterium]|nr:CPBP family intramembrane metalloprotease [Peptostreptococcaceae bacterium]